MIIIKSGVTLKILDQIEPYRTTNRQPYEDPEWIEQVVLIGWSFYEEWTDGLEEAIISMMRYYRIGIPTGTGQLLPPTLQGRRGLVNGLIRTYYLENHEDANWHPYIALCSLTNPVSNRGLAEVSLPLEEMHELINQSNTIFTNNRPFFYLFHSMIHAFANPMADAMVADAMVADAMVADAMVADAMVCSNVSEYGGCLPELPIEMMFEILSHLDALSIYQMSKVNRLWCMVTHSRELQRMLKFPDPIVHYLVNFTTSGLCGNCGVSW
jgi:hypothetical protein